MEFCRTLEQECARAALAADKQLRREQIAFLATPVRRYLVLAQQAGDGLLNLSLRHLGHASEVGLRRGPHRVAAGELLNVAGPQLQGRGERQCHCRAARHQIPDGVGDGPHRVIGDFRNVGVCEEARRSRHARVCGVVDQPVLRELQDQLLAFKRLVELLGQRQAGLLVVGAESLAGEVAVVDERRAVGQRPVDGKLLQRSNSPGRDCLQQMRAYGIRQDGRCHRHIGALKGLQMERWQPFGVDQRQHAVATEVERHQLRGGWQWLRSFLPRRIAVHLKPAPPRPTVAWP